jgi:hypothetical protein
MRPTVIRLIAGGALGTAFSIALTLPGSVVFPDEPPIRQLAAPKAPSAKVLHAAPMVERATKASARPRVVVRRVYVPSAGTVPATSAVRDGPTRSKPLGKPVERAPAPVGQPVTPLAAPSAKPVTEPAEEPTEADEPKAEDPKKADEPKKAKEPKAEKPRKSEKPKKSEKPRKSGKPKQSKKPKARGSEKKAKPDRKQDRDDQGEDRRDEDEHGGGRGDDSRRG